jgi:hypothetical protein
VGRLKLEGCARATRKVEVDIVVIIDERACSTHLGGTPQVGTQLELERVSQSTRLRPLLPIACPLFVVVAGPLLRELGPSRA